MIGNKPGEADSRNQIRTVALDVKTDPGSSDRELSVFSLEMQNYSQGHRSKRSKRK